VGIVEAIQYEVDSIRKSGLVQIESTIEKGSYYIGEQNSVVIFRMFQEMINNALKHAKAAQINVSIKNPDGNTFVLSIIDNGIGFNVQDVKSRGNSSTGVGLRSMTNRAALIGAKFDLQSKPGFGTKVTITLPLSR
jgi:signal transduction histidine kinase